MGSVATRLSSRTVSFGTLRARHLDGEHWVLELSGEADITTMDMLRRELAQVAVRDRQDSEVDVTRLSFCDVASAHLLLTAQRTIPVTLTGATGSVKRVFDLVGALRAQGLHRPRSPIHSTGAIGVSVWW
jgi:ABC-type transporter Mla MlaB component